MIQNEST
jgi:hypothetical protein